MKLFVHCGKVINPDDASVKRATTIVVEGEEICDVLPGYVEPGGNGTVVSWGDHAVIPGIFNCHDHVTVDTKTGGPMPADNDVATVLGIRAVSVCQQFLKQGVTTVRDTGAKRGINIAIQKALKDGLFTGPDLIVSGHRISRTGFAKWSVCREVDGPGHLRRAVREEYKNGAEFIKLMVSGVVSGEGSPYDPQYSYDEIQAAVEEAHDLNLKVAVHAYGGVGASRAIRAGADSIEHGASLSDEDIEAMAHQGAFFVMTYDAMHHISVSKTAPAYLRDKAQSMIESYAVTLPKIRRAGIKVTVGGDSHGFDPSAEAAALVQNSFTHAEALCALTVNGAVLCDMPDKGQIRPGFTADMVALDGNPLEDVKALRNVKGVIKKGRLLN